MWSAGRPEGEVKPAERGLALGPAVEGVRKGPVCRGLEGRGAAAVAEQWTDRAAFTEPGAHGVLGRIRVGGACWNGREGSGVPSLRVGDGWAGGAFRGPQHSKEMEPKAPSPGGVATKGACGAGEGPVSAYTPRFRGLGESRTQPRGLGRSHRSSGREAQRVCVLEARRRKWLDEKGVTTWHVTCFATGTSKRQAEDRASDLTVCRSWRSQQRAGDMKSAGEVAGGERVSAPEATSGPAGDTGRKERRPARITHADPDQQGPP